MPRGHYTAGDVFYTISTHVEDLAKERVYPVFLVDEAHLLHQDTLDHLHILLNYAWDSRALLSLILIGLSELDDRMRLRRNRSLYSRLHHRLSVGPLSPEDTADYVRVRLARVGGSKDVETLLRWPMSPRMVAVREFAEDLGPLFVSAFGRDFLRGLGADSGFLDAGVMKLPIKVDGSCQC